MGNLGGKISTYHEITYGICTCKLISHGLLLGISMRYFGQRNKWDQMNGTVHKLQVFEKLLMFAT